MQWLIKIINIMKIQSMALIILQIKKNLIKNNYNHF